MKALIAVLLAGAAAPALAQQSGNSQPTNAPVASTCSPEHAAMGHCTMPATKPQPAPACLPEHAAMGHCTLPATKPQPQPAPECLPEHAAMGHCTLPATKPQPAQSECLPEHAAIGHCTLPATKPEPAPAACLPEHAAMGHCTLPTSGQPSEPPVGPPPAEALTGPENAADAAWGHSAMETGRAVLFSEHGNMPASKLLIDQLETRVRRGRDGYFVNAEGWYGGDIDKLWIKSEVEGAYGGKPEQAELQALWSHAIDPWFDLQAGVRLDARPEKRARLALGVQGLAPYWIEIDAAAFLSNKGDITARFEAEHDVRITQQLVLQPRAEFDFSLQDIPREHVGAGLSTAELGLRLRYQIKPNFAPYVGVGYEHSFGGTRRFLKEDGDDPSSLSFVVGLRTWF